MVLRENHHQLLLAFKASLCENYIECKNKVQTIKKHRTDRKDTGKQR